MHKVIENWESESCFPKHYKLDRLSKFTLQSLNLTKDKFVTLNYVGEDTIQKLNFKYREINKPTDILSFEWNVLKYEFDIDNQNTFNKEQASLEYLGDIFICEKQAIKKLQNYYSSLEDIYELLVVHGILHLNGYDHITDSDYKIMYEKEQEVLKEYHSKFSLT